MFLGWITVSFFHPSPQESEKLESINADLKAQIEELKQQKQQLVYMLNLHRPTCIVRAQNPQTPEDERNLFIQHIKESTLQLHDLTSTTTSSASTSTAAPLGGGLLTLDHVQCPSHLWSPRVLSRACNSSISCCWCRTDWFRRRWSCHIQTYDLRMKHHLWLLTLTCRP